jgi:hypothetical protein
LTLNLVFHLAIVTGSVVIIVADPKLSSLSLVTIVTTHLNVFFLFANMSSVTGYSIFEVVATTVLANIDVTSIAAQELFFFFVIAITLIATADFIL